MVCKACVDRYYIPCAHCEKLITQSSSYFSELTDKRYCSDCINELFACCDSCGETNFRENVIFDEDSDNYYCSECHRKVNIIRDYNYKPEPEFFGEGRIFYGHEIEVVGKNDKFDDAKKVLNLFGEIVYCKYDRSLPNNGFEIVTHPMSYEYTIENKVFDKFKDIDYIRSFKHPECGHHIHVSKSAFKSALHLAKCIVFFAQNEIFVEFIAQRRHNHYSQAETKKIAFHKVRHPRSFDRYSAINLRNENTVEFRIFKGNLAPDKIIKNLQFVKCLIEFVSDSSLMELTEKNFLAYLKNTHYTELKSFCNKYNIQDNL
jgi:hypothetical protein